MSIGANPYGSVQSILRNGLDRAELAKVPRAQHVEGQRRATAPTPCPTMLPSRTATSAAPTTIIEEDHAMLTHPTTERLHELGLPLTNRAATRPGSSECPAGFDRNRWLVSVGIDGWNRRNPQLIAAAMAMDTAACVAAGAAELHLHPRGPDGRESLAPAAMDATVLAIRRACPGTLAGVSTGAWIEGDADRTLACIENWRELPDYASVNLAEPSAPAVMERLWRRGIGVEAGLASVADAERLVALGLGARALRILIEIEEQDEAETLVVVEEVQAVLTRAGLRRPVLLHGLDATVWRFVARAAERRFSRPR